MLSGWIFYPEAESSMLGQTCLPNLNMASSIIPIIFRWQYECELFDFQEDTVLSLDCSTHLYILSCTLTTCWLRWDHSTRNTSGGRNTSLLCRWLVASQLIKCDFYLKLQSLNIPYYFIIKPTRCTNFTNIFWHETLHVLDSPSVHCQEFIHCTLSNGICRTAFKQDQDVPEFHPGPARLLSTNLYDIYHCWVYCE